MVLNLHSGVRLPPISTVIVCGVVEVHAPHMTWYMDYETGRPLGIAGDEECSRLDKIRLAKVAYERRLDLELGTLSILA